MRAEGDSQVTDLHFFLVEVQEVVDDIEEDGAPNVGEHQQYSSCGGDGEHTVV
jgi:hypothetical protein